MLKIQKDLGKEIIEKLKELDIQIIKLKEDLKNGWNELPITLGN